MIVKSAETKIKPTCDQLVAWGFCCNQRAEYLVKSLDSPEYAIMCKKHKTGFERYQNQNVEYHEYSLELNRKYALEATEFWKKKELDFQTPSAQNL